MGRDSGNSGGEESVDDMLQHMDDAKENYQAKKEREERFKGYSQRETVIRSNADVAVLSSNHEARLQELVDLDAVTHRAGKAWTSAKAAVDEHGGVPIYYRQDGAVTHKGIISKIKLHPTTDTPGIEEFINHITDDDTYEDYNDKLDTTVYIVRQGERLDEPFPQSDLVKIWSGENINEDYSYQPAYVLQRPGDFPNFPEAFEDSS